MPDTEVHHARSAPNASRSAISLHLDTFRRLRLGGGPADPGTTTPEGDGAGQDQSGKTFNRAKLVCACYP